MYELMSMTSVKNFILNCTQFDHNIINGEIFDACNVSVTQYLSLKKG